MNHCWIRVFFATAECVLVLWCDRSEKHSIRLNTLQEPRNKLMYLHYHARIQEFFSGGWGGEGVFQGIIEIARGKLISVSLLTVCTLWIFEYSRGVIPVSLFRFSRERHIFQVWPLSHIQVYLPQVCSSRSEHIRMDKLFLLKSCNLR